MFDPYICRLVQKSVTLQYTLSSAANQVTLIVYVYIGVFSLCYVI